MDGNGRWAKKRALPRAVGHQRGVEAVRRLVRALEPTGLECLTLYAFSSENWKRSEDEVDDLMNLMRRFIKSDLPEFIANNVKLKIIGDWQSLAPDIVAMLEDALAQTANGKQTLAVALNYGGQHEIARAAAKAAESGKPADIATKMVEGSVQKYLKEVSLFNQSFVKNDKQTVEQMLKASGTTVKAFTLYVVGEGIEKKVDDFAAEVAAQVAAAQAAA